MLVWYHICLSTLYIYEDTAKIVIVLAMMEGSTELVGHEMAVQGVWITDDARLWPKKVHYKKRQCSANLQPVFSVATWESD